MSGHRPRNIPVSHICSLTVVLVSMSLTIFVMKLAPTVDAVCAGLNEPLQYLMTSDVLPTPAAPSTTILASRADELVVDMVPRGCCLPPATRSRKTSVLRVSSLLLFTYQRR